MVNQDIVNYLKEGKKRGFSLQILKQKLLEGGFEDKEINFAISEINRLEVASKPLQMQTPKPVYTPVVQQRPQTNPPLTTNNKVVFSNQSKPVQSNIPKQQLNAPTQTVQFSPNSMQTSQISQAAPINSVKLPIINNPILSKKPNLNGDSISLWLKISGVLGIAILVFSIIFSFAVLTLKNNLVSIIYIAIIILFLIFYLYGFLRLGKRVDSQLMKLSSLFMIILLVLGLIIFIFSALSENNILESFSTLASNTNTGFAAFLVISTTSILILFIISKILFSISLLKNKSNIKLAGLTGIVNIAVCAFALISLLLLVILLFTHSEVFTGISNTSLNNLGESLMKVSTIGMLFVISLTIMVALKFISMILEIVMLFKNSKNF